MEADRGRSEADASALVLALRAAGVPRDRQAGMLVAAGFAPVTAVRAACLPGDGAVAWSVLGKDALLAVGGGWYATLLLAQALGLHPLAFATAHSPVASTEAAFERLGLLGRYQAVGPDGRRLGIVSAAVGTPPWCPERWHLGPGLGLEGVAGLVVVGSEHLAGIGAGEVRTLTATVNALPNGDRGRWGPRSAR